MRDTAMIRYPDYLGKCNLPMFFADIFTRSPVAATIFILLQLCLFILFLVVFLNSLLAVWHRKPDIKLSKDILNKPENFTAKGQSYLQQSTRSGIAFVIVFISSITFFVICKLLSIF